MSVVERLWEELHCNQSSFLSFYTLILYFKISKLFSPSLVMFHSSLYRRNLIKTFLGKTPYPKLALKPNRLLCT